ncbi:hypothetical protein BDY17DRAFT_118541 [Neohortaea acidophila]|uniref:Uncharacterized protein n=1 Tax=Neohortaea acidophila TaxID=245834 RepID=A0A6A6PW15_9PEZI|nr:uncharacterized protein BDY17DRAFT_118541 [Neohortaea acidophila]KAF2483956.1 hypothetical protein BDY17DRAFT_118541 [Neohortaea acidophila]
MDGINEALMYGAMPDYYVPEPGLEDEPEDGQQTNTEEDKGRKTKYGSVGAAGSIFAGHFWNYPKDPHESKAESSADATQSLPAKSSIPRPKKSILKRPSIGIEDAAEQRAHLNEQLGLRPPMARHGSSTSERRVRIESPAVTGTLSPLQTSSTETSSPETVIEFSEAGNTELETLVVAPEDVPPANQNRPPGVTSSRNPAGLPPGSGAQPSQGEQQERRESMVEEYKKDRKHRRSGAVTLTEQERNEALGE